MNQEQYYQYYAEHYLATLSDYMDFLLHCIEIPASNKEEVLARKEFIDSWHEAFKDDAKKL